MTQMQFNLSECNEPHTGEYLHWSIIQDQNKRTPHIVEQASAAGFIAAHHAANQHNDSGSFHPHCYMHAAAACVQSCSNFFQSLKSEEMFSRVVNCHKPF